MMEWPVPARADVHPAIRECFCDVCGLIAPSWFHSDFLLHGGGFTCMWCAFPQVPHEREKPSGPYRTVN